MATIHKSIEVRVPARAAYARLADFQQFPRFLDGVKEVRRTDERHLTWRSDAGGREMVWDAEIIEQREGECIEWQSTSGQPMHGSVTLQAIEQDRTRIDLHLDYAEEQGEMHLNADLQRFRSVIEEGAAGAQGARTGAGTADDARGPRGDPGTGTRGAGSARSAAGDFSRDGSTPADATAGAGAEGEATGMGSRDQLRASSERAAEDRPPQDTGVHMGGLSGAEDQVSAPKGGEGGGANLAPGGPDTYGGTRFNSPGAFGGTPEEGASVGQSGVAADRGGRDEPEGAAELGTAGLSGGMADLRSGGTDYGAPQQAGSEQTGVGEGETTGLAAGANVPGAAASGETSARKPGAEQKAPATRAGTGNRPTGSPVDADRNKGPEGKR